MAQDKISVTISFVKDHYEVSAFMEEVDILPETIFLYENNGTTTLGAYYGIASASELTTRQVWAGVEIPTFGNRFVRHDEALIIVPNQEEADKAKAWLIERAKQLKEEILSLESNTQVVTI